MKLDAVDRMAVESIRHANTVRITINEGQKDERSFVFDQSRGDFTAFRRGLRLTTQDYIRDCMRERSRSLILN